MVVDGATFFYHTFNKDPAALLISSLVLYLVLSCNKLLDMQKLSFVHV